MTTLLKPYLIGETAYHHEGDVDFLARLINDIADIGLQAVKFHLLLELGSYFQKNHPLRELISKFMFSKQDWRDLLRASRDRGLDVVALCDDVESIQFILEENLPATAIELHATGLNDHFQLSALRAWKGRVMLGVGGSTLDEIQYAVEFLRNQGNGDIVLMHGFQNYPTDFREIRFSRMSKLHALFDLPVGYADHTDPANPHHDVISAMGAVLGFAILEKHYTPCPGEKRIDQQAAASREQLAHILELMEVALTARGVDPLQMSAAEQQYGRTGPMKKAIVARRPIAKGQVIGPEDLWFKRTAEVSPFRQLNLPLLLKARALRNIQEDEVLSYNNLEFPA